MRSLGSDTLRPVGFVSYYVYKDTCMVLGCLFSSAIIKPSLCSVLLSHYCLQIGVIMKRNLGSESVKETGVPVIFIQTQGSWITVLSCIHLAGSWFALMFGSISRFVPQLNRLVACDRIASLEHPEQGYSTETQPKFFKPWSDSHSWWHFSNRTVSDIPPNMKHYFIVEKRIIGGHPRTVQSPGVFSSVPWFIRDPSRIIGGNLP